MNPYVNNEYDEALIEASKDYDRGFQNAVNQFNRSIGRVWEKYQARVAVIESCRKAGKPVESKQ